MADNFHPLRVQQLVLLLKPRAALFVPLHRQMTRIAVVGGGVGQAPKVRAVETELHDLRFGLEEKGDVLRVVVLGPVGDHPSEFEAGRVLSGGGKREDD
jgi:hypothetical protein